MLKYRSEEESSDDDDMAYLIKRFQKIVRKNKGIRKGANVPRTATQNDTCHKSVHCSKPKTKNIKIQEVIKKNEGTWYSIK